MERTTSNDNDQVGSSPSSSSPPYSSHSSPSSDLVTTRPLLAQSLVLSRISSSPTLLPENLAKLVTALSLAARVSLRTSALFLEAILEGLQGTTVASLGVTRRCLIAAVGSARALHYVKGGLDWSGRDQEGNKTDDAFLNLLDKYTNLGIYLIHHSFTLAELFTMSSFYLTLNTIQTVSTAAEESVRMLDSILGSNESSRALSSIITLVRNELSRDGGSGNHHHFPGGGQDYLEDEEEEGGGNRGGRRGGTLKSLTSLTKAITAFACLQTATHRRTLKELKMRVVYDCTIVLDHEQQQQPGQQIGTEEGKGGEGEVSPTLKMKYIEPSLEDAGRYAGPNTTNLAKKRKRSSLRMTTTSASSTTTTTSTMEPHSATTREDFHFDQDDQGGGGVITDVRSEYERFTHSSRSSRGTTPRMGRSRTTSKAASVYSTFEGDEEEEAEGGMRIDSSLGGSGGGGGGFQGLGEMMELQRLVPGEDEIVQGLNELVGLPEMTTSSKSTTTTRDETMNDLGDGDGEGDGLIDESELPDEVRIALRELERGRSEDDDDEVVLNHRRIVRPIGQNGRGYSYEIQVEETTTTMTTTIRTVQQQVDGGGDKIVSRKTRERGLPLKSTSNGHVEDDTDVEMSRQDEEEDWIEVSQESKNGDGSNVEMDIDRARSRMPSASNGRDSVGGNLAVQSRKEALEQPAENRQRLQVVLSTMTKRFTQRKRTVRRLSDSRGPSPSLPSPAASSPSSSPTIGWSRSPRNPVEDLRSQVATPQPASTASTGRGKSVFRAFSKPFRPQPPVSSSPSSRLPSPPVPPSSNSLLAPTPVPPLKTAPSPYATPRATPSPAATPAQSPPPSRHERSISASTLAPPSAPRPPDDLPPQPKPLPPQPPQQSSYPAEPSPTTATSNASLRRKPSGQTLRSSTLMTTCKHTPSKEEAEEREPRPTNFPHQHLVRNLQHFARYSSAAYGQSFLRILGLAKSEFKFPHTEIHANNHAFAHHVGIHVEDILLSSFTDPQANLSNEKISPIVNYVAVDHSMKAVVLSCRGSLGLSDILVDLTCDYEPMPVPDADPHGSYLVHSGMFLSATTLQRGTVHDVIKEALERYPEYGFVVCGHSLGGGVAALLSILWSCPSTAYQRRESEIVADKGRPPSHPPISTPFVTSFSSGLPPGRAIACYTYGVPCVSSVDLATYSQGLIISTVHNYDIVPTLSLGVLRDLKTMAMGFYAETGVAEEIVGRVVGLCQRRFMAKRSAKKAAATLPCPPLPTDEDEPITPEALTDPSEESRLVPLTDRELQTGRSANKALEPSYTDPSLLGSDMADDVELSDWLWSLRKTIRASSDNEKLYPPGTVYVVENYTVFISSESSEGQYSRREGRRVLLRAVDDVERRFSEPVFSRTMLSDHSPKSYETNCDLLAAAAM